jgi:hypothetical protein
MKGFVVVKRIYRGGDLVSLRYVNAAHNGTAWASFAIQWCGRSG